MPEEAGWEGSVWESEELLEVVIAVEAGCWIGSEY